ncbi:MAG: hypothetical protein WCX73_00260 [Candidatus Pacearchaeota archaeon]|jgi:hypothetical protein
MPNEEIISALRNAIEHGDSLQEAIQIMINSGYNLEEVHEASRFIGGTLSLHETKSGEHLTMPEEKKSFSSKLKFWGNNKKQTSTIQPPSESMKISKKPINNQNLVLTKTLQSPQTQQTPHPQQLRPQYSQQNIPQQNMQPRQLSQYSQQPTQMQIKQSFQKPFQQYPAQFQQKSMQPQQFQQQLAQQTILRQAPRAPQLMKKSEELLRENQKTTPKQSYAREIILLIILLVLIGILALTIFFKDKILGWFG